MNKVNVRYGRKYDYDELTPYPKNTLVTVRDGDIIYFGIARCHINMDTFVKDIGKKIAGDRAELASAEISQNISDLVLHKSKLRGAVPVDKVVSLLRYFENIDEECLKRSQE